MLKRNVQIIFRLTKSENRHLKAQMKRTGLSQSAYLRMLIMGHVPKEQPPVEYHRFIQELNAIGNSMNQIAARANATGFFLAEEYEQCRDALFKKLLEIQGTIIVPEKGAAYGNDKNLERKEPFLTGS